MRLILTGGGDSRHFERIDSHFIRLLGKKPSLLFIPLAEDGRRWRTGLSRITETFSTIQFDNIEMCIDLSKLTWDYLKNFSAIYIDGGNTFKLMANIRMTHTYELLCKFLYHGGVINGDSAGAIVLGSHIETAHFGDSADENRSGIISYQGLNLLGQWAIHCHYTKAENRQIQRFVREFGYPVLALYEQTAVSIHKQRIKVIGKRPAVLIKADQILTIEDGQSHRLGI